MGCGVERSVCRSLFCDQCEVSCAPFMGISSFLHSSYHLQLMPFQQLYSNPFDNITFQGLESLEELDMNKTFVTEIPVGLKGLPNLLRLNMRKCKLKMIPDWVGEIPKLEMLNVGENAIDAVPASLGDAPAMKYLLLDGNAMLNELPDSLTKLNLIRVDIRKTSVPLDSSTVDSLRSKCFSNNGWLKPEAL